MGQALLLLGTAVVAALYGAVGHGGASGYLAVMVLASVPPEGMKGTALVLNLLVAGLAWAQYARAGRFSWRLAGPFALGSVPAAFLGARLQVPAHLYQALLAAALALAAIRLLLPPRADTGGSRPPPFPAAAGIGAAIGLVSGIVGVGGGIFLSPLLMLLGWAGAKETAAASAAFIVLNSASALAGHLGSHPLDLRMTGAMLLAAAAGGAAGTAWGAWRASEGVLRRLLGIVLLVAAGKAIAAG